MTQKIDLKRELDCYRAQRGRFRVLHVPPLQYLMIDGSGDPNTSPAFATAVEALYPLAFALKFASMVRRAREDVARRSRAARLDGTRFETLAEGRCVQTLHVAGCVHPPTGFAPSR